MRGMSTDTPQDPLHFYLDKSNPAAWKAIGALSNAAKEQAQQAGLDPQLVELVMLRVSQINGCSYCLDVHTKRAVKAGVSDQRRGLLPTWEDAAVYSEQEKAALALAETVTRLPGPEDRDACQVVSHGALTDEQYSAVQWLAITINTTNRISIMSHHPVRREKDRS
ncbi:Carboxymuconolactone decarboxylase family protein [Kocuria varians]